MGEDIRTLKKTLIFQQETSTEKQQKQENHELLQTKTPNWKGGSVVIYADYFTFGLILLHQEQSHVFKHSPEDKQENPILIVQNLHR